MSVGITMERIQGALTGRLPTIALATVLVLGTGVLGAWLISRRLRRQTHGLGEGEITRMYEYYDAVLHAVREGLLLVDTEGRVQLVNDEAKRLLTLDATAVGRPVADLGFPPSLTRTVLATDSRPDEIHLVDDAVLVVNTAPASWQGREVGTVVTLRDHTEIQAVAGELDTVRGLAESLRSQNHEAANRLHTVVSLVELGRVEEAMQFATDELEVAQLLTDRVVGSVADPVVSALLLGKTAQAAERGVRLRITESTDVTGLPVEQRDVVTILGNLIDNAIDAVGESERTGGRGDGERVAGRPRGARRRLRAGRPGRGGAPGVRARVVDQDLRRSRRPRPRAGPGGAGRPQVRRADGRRPTPDLGGAFFSVRIGRALVSDVRVLVVEDDELAAEAHAGYVRRTSGFEVVGVARTAKEAARLLGSTPVDLVLLDMNLPDGHGLGLLQSLRSEGFLCDVIAVTAARDVEVVKRAVSQGVVLYLLKPFTYAGFRTKLDQYADYRARLTESESAVGQDDVDRMLGPRGPRRSRRPCPRG